MRLVIPLIALCSSSCGGGVEEAMRDVTTREKTPLAETQSLSVGAAPEARPVRTLSVGPSGPEQVASSADAVSGFDLQLGFVSISYLHQEFFRTEEPLSALYAAMHTHVNDQVTVVVSYRSQTPRGWVHAELSPLSLKKPVGSVEEGLVIDALTPVTKALSDYRNWVWSNRDIRIGNFNVALVLNAGKAECKFTVTGDVFPPDGSELSPCVVTAGKEFCGEITDGVLRFPADTQGAIAVCFES